MKTALKINFMQFLLLCLLFTFVGGLQVDAQGAKSTELFNGKDFTGWTFYLRSNSAPEKTWCVTNGVIHCAGRPVGYARTKAGYHDYKLTVEWRFVKVARRADNTGILIHMQLPDKIWPQCIECQGQHRRQGDFWLQSGVMADGYSAATGKPVHVPMTGVSHEKPVGEWNTYEIIARGNTVQTSVNGRLMDKITGCSVASGFIGIQCEGAEIEVRKMQVESLPDNLENGK